MAKYKKGQTWPKGAFTAGLSLTFSDKELREGYDIFESVKVRKPYRMAKRGEETEHDFMRVIKKKRYYPAGKPLETDTQIRRYRKKWILGTPEFKKNLKWVVREWFEPTKPK